MDNLQSTELTKELLLKVLTGDRDISATMLHTLAHLGLIKKRAEGKNKVGIDAWLASPVTHFELTAKGLRRLQGE